MIRKATPSDAKAIVDIYNYYIAHSIATFDEKPFTMVEMASKINHVSKTYPWLVKEINGKVIGFAYASEWRAKSAYKFASETTIYFHPDAPKGLGTALYSRLLEILQTKNIHTAIGVISVPNEPSVRLHQKLGFIKAARFKEVGFKFDKWIDVDYWQLMLNDFSPQV